MKTFPTAAARSALSSSEGQTYLDRLWKDAAKNQASRKICAQAELLVIAWLKKKGIELAESHIILTPGNNSFSVRIGPPDPVADDIVEFESELALEDQCQCWVGSHAI